MPLTSARSEAARPGLHVWHYDGVSGVKQQRLLKIHDDAFRLISPDGAWESYAFADLIARDTQDGGAVFALKKRPGWRIGFAGAVPEEIAEHLPRVRRYGGLIDRVGLWRSSFVFAVLAAGAITLFLRTPAAVARAVPPSLERKLGDLMVGDFGHRACAGPGGPEALAAMLQRIDPKDRTLDVRVVNLPIVNAVTLPGGKIVIFNRLLQEARTPEEIAGVLAHEIGHVRHHDVMESLLRQLGLSVLLGGLDGKVGGYTNTLLAATYSRDAEARADGYALDALNQAGVSPEPMAQFFRRMAGGEMKGEGAARIMTYFSTHPMSEDRARRFDQAARGHGGYRPVLDADAWAKLRAICSSDPDAEKPGFRF